MGREINGEKIKAWVTKYALTKGIYIVDAHVCSDTMIAYGNVRRIGYCSQYAHGNDWHRTLEAALARAEEMRRAKIASLSKSIVKLEKLKFNVPN